MELNLTVPEQQNKKGAAVTLSDAVFAAEFNETLVHQIVTAYLAKARAGTKAQKTRSEVRGGGAKPFKQKGTGRARAGTIRSPIWRTGGVTFAAKPRDHAQKVNKKMYKAAMRSIFSELARNERLIIVDEFSVPNNKTKELKQKMKNMGLENVLIVCEDVNKELYLAARNIHGVDVRDVAGIDPVSLVSFDNVIVTVPVVKKVEEMLA